MTCVRRATVIERSHASGTVTVWLCLLSMGFDAGWSSAPSFVLVCAAAAWQLLPQVGRGFRELGGLPAPEWAWIAVLVAAIAVGYLFSALSLVTCGGPPAAARP